MMSLKRKRAPVEPDPLSCCLVPVLVFLAVLCITILVLSAAYRPVTAQAAVTVNANCTAAAITVRSLPVKPNPTVEIVAYIQNRNAKACAPFIAKIIYDQFGPDAMLMTIVAWWESGFNLTARNETSGCYGIFQLSPGHKKAMAKLGLDFHNPEHQAKFAKILFDARGLKPWVVGPKAKAELKARQR
jgi:hypothetical protein